jgi:hypothetical protein
VIARGLLGPGSCSLFLIANASQNVFGIAEQLWYQAPVFERVKAHNI